MKQFILIFLILFLVWILIKKRENFYLLGCKISDLKNPNEQDFYNCYLGDFDELKFKNIFTGYQYLNMLNERVKNYFLDLYRHGLEKHFRPLVIIVPAYRYTKEKLTIESNANKKYENFMEPSHVNGIYNFQYPFNGQGTAQDNINNLGKAKIDLNHGPINGLYVSVGFKFGLSTRENNQSGYKCTKDEHRPYQKRDGHCIPGRFDDYNLFINGGKYFNYNDLALFSEDRNKAGGVKYHQWEKTKWIFHLRKSGHSSKGCGNRTEQKDIQRQRKLDSCMSSCYCRSRKGCHQAYGNPSIRQIFLVPDIDFFNIFYAKRITDMAVVEKKFDEFQRKINFNVKI